MQILIDQIKQICDLSRKVFLLLKHVCNFCQKPVQVIQNPSDNALFLTFKIVVCRSLSDTGPLRNVRYLQSIYIYILI